MYPAPLLQCDPVRTPEVLLPRLTGQLLADVVHRKGVSAGGLDGWGWREFKVLPVFFPRLRIWVLARWVIGCFYCHDPQD